MTSQNVDVNPIETRKVSHAACLARVYPSNTATELQSRWHNWSLVERADH